MAVVPEVRSIATNGHEVRWLENDLPAVGSTYRLRPRESYGDAYSHWTRAWREKDFSILRDWLPHCSKYHDEASKRRTRDQPVSRGFRVIDCNEDPPVVKKQPRGITYVALSYVWGKWSDNEKLWLRTVQDVVVVTKELGLQYL